MKLLYGQGCTPCTIPYVPVCCIRASVCIHCVSVSICVYMCDYQCMCVSLSASACVGVCVRVCVYVCVCACMQTNTHQKHTLHN